MGETRRRTKRTRKPALASAIRERIVERLCGMDQRELGDFNTAACYFWVTANQGNSEQVLHFARRIANLLLAGEDERH